MTQSINIEIQQGATFSLAVSVGSTYDGWTGAAKVKRNFVDSYPSFTLTASKVASGVLTVSMTATETAAIEVPCQALPSDRTVFVGYFDATITDGSTVVRAAEGRATLSRQVTGV